MSHDRLHRMLTAKLEITRAEIHLIRKLMRHDDPTDRAALARTVAKAQAFEDLLLQLKRLDNDTLQ